jgi:hypothetical protein
MKTIDRFILILLQSLIDKNIDVVVYLMVFNATFNTISFISWRLVLLVEEAGENHRPVTSH